MSASASASLCESRLAASLDHPNVVSVYDAGEADGRLFIAMRYVEDGVDLRTLLREAAPLAPERVVGIAAQLAEALDAAHQRGLVHRDVKPSNVLLDQRSDRDHAYLADFGLTHSPATAAPRTGSSWAPSSMSDQGVERRDDTAPRRLDALTLGERGDTLHVRRTNRARVVDRHVERTEAPFDLRERGIDRRAVADVRLDGEAGAEFVDNLLGRSDAHVQDGHRRALGGEPAADRRADA
jgi:serine/threonine protein kinase